MPWPCKKNPEVKNKRVMKKELILTKDGSHSLYVPQLNETYHSVHGSVAESLHVFIKNGLNYNTKVKLNILEIGFGTGLNTLLTLLHSDEKQIYYTGLEPYPISEEIFSKLNFSELVDTDKEIFLNLHLSEWEKDIKLSDRFTLHKSKNKLQEFEGKNKFDVIYFDAFAPEKQEEMWTEDVFKKCYNLLKKDGYLVTYCAKGVVKRTLRSAGFIVESLEGPPRKREMIRANKLPNN